MTQMDTEPLERSGRREAARFTALAAAMALAIFGLDALSKTAVAAALAPGDARELMPGWLVLAHVRNTGAAYGLLAGQGWLLVPVSLVVTVVVPIVVWRAGLWRAQPIVGGLAAGLILGGALGNLVERIQSGAVTDFIQVVPIPLFQVFNVSDAAICVGAALLLLLANRRPAPAS
jgi:signal peptidase II